MTSPEDDDRYEFVREQHAIEMRTFSRSVMTLAGGALGLSVAFVQEVVPPGADGNRSSTVLLLLGWIALVASLVAVVASYYTGAEGLRADMASMDPDENRWDKATERLNLVSGTLLAVGLLLLALFAYNNL